MKFYSEKLSPRRLSLQWRLTLLISGLVITACALMYFFISRSAVTGLEGISDYVVLVTPDNSNPISINVDPKILIPDLENQIQNTKNKFLFQSMIATGIIILLSSICTWFVTRRALTPLRRFSDRISQVQAQNLSDSRIEENNVKELNQLGISYNKMLERLSEAFEIQRQFTANAAHELRTPLALMQVQLDLYNSASHPGNDADTLQTIKMVTEQNDKLNRMVKTLLDMSELQSVGRDDKIILDAIVEEVLADLEPLAVEKNIKLIGKCEDATMIGSDILIYRLVYNLVENAIKYNHPLGQVTVTAYQRNKHVYLSVEDTGSGIPKELRERVFEPFFRVDKSRSRENGGVGLGLSLVWEIADIHGGKVQAEESTEKGTVMTVTFPLNREYKDD